MTEKPDNPCSSEAGAVIEDLVAKKHPAV
jgi:hypothetical protein